MLLAILGNHPLLSLAELMSVYGAAQVRQVSDTIAQVDSDKAQSLGGTIKIAKVLAELPPTLIADLDLAKYVPAGKKIPVGISVYGSKISPRRLNQIAIGIKRQLKARGTAVRIVPNKQPALSSAQVLHNRLVDKGIELIIVFNKANTFIARTVFVQDIEAYSRRDYGRPYRDPKVGMLPPKLAQIMLNLAQPQAGSTIFDPFCGTGVVLQEALLMGYRANGSDISERMVDYSTKNLAWLKENYGLKSSWQVVKTDARMTKFCTPIDAVVTETDLGPPLSQSPSPSRLATIRSQANNLIAAFLKNLAGQVKLGTPLCLAVPCWKTPNQLVYLPLIEDAERSRNIDPLKQLGYTFKRFNGIDPINLIYRRPQQIVGRQILVLTRK